MDRKITWRNKWAYEADRPVARIDGSRICMYSFEKGWQIVMKVNSDMPMRTRREITMNFLRLRMDKM